MSSLQKRISISSTVCGTILALVVVAADAMRVLQPLESWLYDLRAATCQYFTPPPSDQIVYLGIDDDALDAFGKWPWHRSVLAEMFDEIRLAEPKAVGIDVLFVDRQEPRFVENPDGRMVRVEDDALLVESLRKLNSAVLPASFEFVDAWNADAPFRDAAIAELAADLRLEPADLVRRLAERGFTAAGVAARVESEFVDLRRDAISSRLRELLKRKPLSREQAELALLETPATTNPVRVRSPLTRAIERQYEQVKSELALRRFSLPVPAKLDYLPPATELKLVPLPELSEISAGSGFADWRIFKDPTVRTVPLFVQSNDRLFPQFALAFACKLLDVEIASIRVDDHYVTLPAADGDIRIPVRSWYSPIAGRSVSMLFDIPWFGTSRWETMYDWPEYKAVKRHYSLNIVGDIVRTRQSIQRNNVILDAALERGPLMSPERLREYQARGLAPEDAATRRGIVSEVLNQLSIDGFDALQQMPDSDLSDEERRIRDSMVAARRALEENAQLVEQLSQQRARVVETIKGKGVLVGWISSAAIADFVTTSLHPRCPGVVVHGVVANAILNRHFLHAAPMWATIFLTFLFGLLATALTSRLPPGRAVVIVVLIAFAYFVANGILFYAWLNSIVDAAAPIVAIFICWGGCMVVRLVLEGLDRIRLAKERAIIEHEISLARQVQAALIPKELKILTNIQSHGWTLAATTTGGDCFDLWKLADGRLGILVADASGHGLGPSIIVSEVRALVRALCDIETEPQKLLERVNQRLASDLQGSKFCTAFVGFLTEDGQMSWGSAGHGPMLWSPTPDGEPHELEGTGLPLGVSEEWFGDESVPMLQLEEGGWLIAVSDGIFEAPTPGGEQFGTERIKQVLKENANATCEQVVERLRDAVHKWQVVKEPADDQTIVIVRRCSVPAETGAETSSPETSTVGEGRGE